MTMHESNGNRDMHSETPSRPRDGYHGHNRNDFVRDFAASIRQNPTAAALISMGVFWLLMGGNRTALFGGTAASPDRAGAISATLSNMGSRIGKGAGAAAATVSDTASEAASQVADGVAAVTSSAGGLVSRAGSAIQETSRAGYGLARTVQNDLGALFERQPLVLGAVGLAIGAGIAAAFPTTEVESRLAGETSDQVKSRTRSFASEQVESGRTLAAQALKEVEREVEGRE
jgi:hypothetical protein